MKEFEEALNRAQALVGGARRDEGDAVTLDPPPSRPTPAAQAASQTRDEPGPAPGPSAAAADGIPVLDVDYSRFRENFGAKASSSRNVDGAFRILRTQVLTAMQDRGAQVLGVTSPGPGAGKSVTAIHLAHAMARQAERQVTLADFDFRRPSVAQYMQAVSFQPSLGYFRGEGSLDRFINRNREGNLYYMLTDRSTEMSAEYLAGHKMDDALEWFCQRGEEAVVVADLPPLVGCDDTLAIMPKLDGIIFVVAEGESTFADIEAAAALVPPEKIVAVVLNKVRDGEVYYDYY